LLLRALTRRWPTSFRGGGGVPRGGMAAGKFAGTGESSTAKGVSMQEATGGQQFAGGVCLRVLLQVS
jgi:hypothetical protein